MNDDICTLVRLGIISKYHRVNFSFIQCKISPDNYCNLLWLHPFNVAIAPVYAGGDKVQHEHGSETAPGQGDDAQGNQVGGD